MNLEIADSKFLCDKNSRLLVNYTLKIKGGGGEGAQKIDPMLLTGYYDFKTKGSKSVSLLFVEF